METNFSIKNLPNYYIHGTNSNIFNLLPYTDFYIMEPINMIETYGIAPITG